MKTYICATPPRGFIWEQPFRVHESKEKISCRLKKLLPVLTTLEGLWIYRRFNRCNMLSWSCFFPIREIRHCHTNGAPLKNLKESSLKKVIFFLLRLMMIGGSMDSPSDRRCRYYLPACILQDSEPRCCITRTSQRSTGSHHHCYRHLSCFPTNKRW